MYSLIDFKLYLVRCGVREIESDTVLGHALQQARRLRSSRLSSVPVSQEEKQGNDKDDQARHIADILEHFYGDDAEEFLDDLGSEEPKRMSNWMPLDHPRGPDGRFIERNSPDAISAARHEIKTSLAGPRTVASLRKLTSSLSILAVKQLRDLKSDYGVKAGGARQSLVDKIAERLHGVIVDSDDDSQTVENIGSKPDVAARENGTPVKPDKVDVYTVPTNSLKIDSKRFQYKISGIRDDGVSEELRATKSYNPELGGVLLVWRDPATGQDYVVNGHHRHELASRTETENVNVRYIDTADPIEARARGALANIAEGRGTALDAAKYLRDSGQSVEHLQRAGISLSGRVAADSVSLTKLSNKAFQQLSEGNLEESVAIAVSKHLAEHDLQTQLFKRLADRERDGKEWSIREIEQAAKKFSNAGKYKETGQDLFGSFEDEKNTFDQEVELESHVSRLLAQEANDFRSVSSQLRADRVSEAGNTIAVDENAKRAKTAEDVANKFEKEAGLKGPVSAAIKSLAIELAQAKSKKDRDAIKAKAVESVRGALNSISAQSTPRTDLHGSDGSVTMSLMQRQEILSKMIEKFHGK